MDNELELGFETPAIKQMVYASTLGNSSYAVIGFRPMEGEIIDKIGKKYHLYV